MARKLLFLILILLISSLSYSWDKSKFDISIDNEHKKLNKSTDLGYDGQEIKKQVSEVTLLQGGYFTIGTNQGLSPTGLDDQCGITFGHPYALTSYPLLSIDGSWEKLENFFKIYDSSPAVRNDSLFISYSSDSMFQFIFNLKPDLSGQKITITSSLKNLDTRSHSIGIGLVFDPGLGKKGDGWAVIGSKVIARDTSLTGSAIPAQLMINERNGLVDGLKLSIDFINSPDKLILANWKDIYENHTPDFSPSLLRKIYDLTVKLIWNERTIPAGGNFSQSVVIDLQQPDFNTPVYMRWDLPGFLSLENNLLFPRSFNSYIEITNLTATARPNSAIEFQFPHELSSSATNYSLAVPANEIVYQPVTMQSKEIYEDQVVDLAVTLKHDDQLLDSMVRSAFIPAIPLADTGLVCTIDTVMTSDYPEIKFTFEAQVEATGQKILNLASENIFLYENNARIQNFSIGKDTTGGVTAADIIFVLDVTGSMGDEINKVKNNIIEFCDSLEARRIDFRLGMVTFLDVIENIYNFTNDPQLFKSYVAAQFAHGGDDTPENSLDALYRASQFPFRLAARRIFIWITDANYHEKDSITPRNKQEVVNQLLSYDVTVHAIGPTGYKTASYNPIIEPTGGDFYDIYGNFRDILLAISRIGATPRYLISYTSPGAMTGTNQITMEVHYAGLGGTATAEYHHGGAANQLTKALSCYPNPFNPTVQINIDLENFCEGKVEIFNILGQRVRLYQLKSSEQNRNAILWDARDDFNRQVGVGTYLVRLTISDRNGNLLKNEIAKVLYLK